MAKKIQSKEELQSNIEKVKTNIRQGENYVKQLLKQSNQLERRQRTHRLIERGAIAESLIDDAAMLTNEQFKTLLSAGLNMEAVRELLAFFKNSNGKAPESQAAQEQ